LTQIAFNVMRTLGPAIGGVIIVFLGPADNFLLQSFANLAIMVTVLRITLPPRRPDPERRAFFRDMAAG
jgi:hypothetical protein